MVKTVYAAIFLLIVAAGTGAQDISYSTPQEYEKVTGNRIKVLNEAPELKARVGRGELPSVEDRLPAEPLVLRPIEEIGQYGGVWKDVGLGARDAYSNYYTLREPLIGWSVDFSRYLPNVARAWETSADSKSFTFYLRKGMKWSDGAPFTADDFVFWYEDILLNDELTPVKPSWLIVGGQMVKLKKVDDYTIRFEFAAAYGIFLDLLCNERDPTLPASPKHYLIQYHPKYTPMEQIKKEMEKAGFDRWSDLFRYKDDPDFNTPGRPQITAWVAQNTLDQPVFIMTRNPYYWKIDIEGNQLPYIDRRERLLVPTLEGMALKIIAGEFTHHWYRLGGNRDFFSIFMENQEKGDYRLVRVGLTARGGTNVGTVFFNFHHKDPVLRKLFLDKRFRIALSVAINREEINELVFDGEAQISQFPGGPGGGLPFWDEKLGKVYTEYDPELANRLLDEIGLIKRDREGYRLRPDGKRLMLVNSVFTLWEGNMEIHELVPEYWKKIGIQVVVKPTSRALWNSQVTAAEHDIASYGATFGVAGEPCTSYSALFPFDNTCCFAPLWGLWFNSRGKEGEEPPQAAKELMKIYEEMKAEPSRDKRNALAKKAFAIHAENLWMIGIVTPSYKIVYRLAKNELRNESADWWIYEYNYITSQFFIKQGNSSSSGQ